jgi:hypothetical protein
LFGGRSFDPGDRRFDGATDLVDAWLAKIEERAAQLRALSATAHSDAGRVTVTVGPDGGLTALTLAEDIRDQPAAHTAQEILATLRAAQASLAARADAPGRAESDEVSGTRPPAA